jgi:hypothetical protein
MDELTRERFWPLPRPLPPAEPVVEDIVGRQMILIGYDDPQAQGGAVQHARLRAEALARSRRLAKAIRVYGVKGPA